MERPPWMQLLIAQLTTFGLKLLGAIVVWIVGRRLIAFVVRLMERALRRGSMDETLVGYAGSGLTILLDVVLVVRSLASSASRPRPSRRCSPASGWRSARHGAAFWRTSPPACS